MCGVCGVFGNKNASQLTFLSLYALQHRGEESAGITSYDGKRVYYHRGMGYVREVFSEQKIKKLKGTIAIGHTRYSTTGSGVIENIQPLSIRRRRTPVVVAHNGHFTNAPLLRKKLEKEGAVFHASTDSELLVHLLARSKEETIKDTIISALKNLEGAYSLVMMIGKHLIGIRDPHGFRPLSIGKLDDTFVICSETCALDLIGASFVRDIAPGEVVIISKDGLRSFALPEKASHALCIFEYIYFARPDSSLFGVTVYKVRKELGKTLAKEHPVASDLVMPLPDSGSYAALGFSQESGIPYELGMIRNHYVGRTFIQPAQDIRNFGVKVKLNPIREVLQGKSVAVVDDSIVRGTTSKNRIYALREAGAKEVHMRVSSSPIISPCFYGVNFPTRRELIAARKSVEDVRKYIGLDSLGYLSMEGMLKSIPQKSCEFCTACFTGTYPTKVPQRVSSKMF